MPAKKNPKAAAKAKKLKQQQQEKDQVVATVSIGRQAGAFRTLMKFRASEACKKALLAHCTSTIPV